MSELNIKLPASLDREVRKLAKRDRISVNQFVASAVAEKMSAFHTVEYLKRRAKNASRGKFEQALKQIPDHPAAPADRLS
ncbi:MAG: hypothetical protein FWD61_20540 [Phycisphaerales bacterium]|nr:hypothetical protein [Phycisphaerales bacterium]